MKTFRVALLQLLPTGSTEGNLEKGLEACRRAAAMGADLALFPEMWSCGYRIESPAQLAGDAVEADGPFVSAFAREARALSMAIGVTFLERYAPAPRNALRLFDRTGAPVLSYAKCHTCDFGEERFLTPGDAFPTARLAARDGELTVGAMICYDREFPESARLLMLGGAELILVPNACPMEINRLSQLRARSYENMTCIATCNYPLGQPDCNGHSSAFDGIAYREGDSGSRDTLVLEAGRRRESTSRASPSRRCAATARTRCTATPSAARRCTRRSSGRRSCPSSIGRTAASAERAGVCFTILISCKRSFVSS